MMNSGSSPFRFLRLSLFILPLLVSVAISVYIIACHHVWPLSRDQWHMYAPYFEKGLWDAAFTPMSTHRHVFPFLFFHADMAWFGGRNHLLVTAGAIFDIAIIALLLITLRRDPSFSATEKKVFAIWIIFVLTWLIDIAQLGWGFMSTQYYLAILCCLLAAHTASYSYPLMIIAGIISTFSFGMGILVWPVLLVLGWILHGSRRFFVATLAGLFLCLAFFLLLPGGDSIRQTLLFSPQETLAFLFHLPAGPIYYLLKSYRFLDVELVKSFAIFVSTIAVSSAIFLLGWLVLKRSALSNFCQLCVCLLLVGLGSSVMITFIRSLAFLDVWVDRYQIWAVLFWLGFIPLAYQFIKNYRPQPSIAKKTVLVFLWGLPLLALPSQLDMGARLAEYNIRVQESLLSYKVGIADKQSAEDALHWNWENKLPYFFTVWRYIKTENKNIFYDGYTDYLGKSANEFLINFPDSEIIAFDLLRTEAILGRDQLDLSAIPEAVSFAHFSGDADSEIIGFRIFAKVPENIHWKYAVFVDEKGNINGLGTKISHSVLPRGNGRYLNKDYNLFAVIRNNEKTLRCYLVDRKSTGRIYSVDMHKPLQ